MILRSSYAPVASDISKSLPYAPVRFPDIEVCAKRFVRFFSLSAYQNLLSIVCIVCSAFRFPSPGNRTVVAFQVFANSVESKHYRERAA